jgi:hypothetical protein
MAIKGQHNSVSAWAKAHNFHVSGVNDIIHRRGYFATMTVPNKGTHAYAILQQLIFEGFGKMVQADGWDITLIDMSKPIQTVAYTPRPSTETDYEKICWDLCELGDEYTCNIFLSPVPDAGPLAILFMMEKEHKHTKFACTYLNKRYVKYDFIMDSESVIFIWAK